MKFKKMDENETTNQLTKNELLDLFHSLRRDIYKTKNKLGKVE